MPSSNDSTIKLRNIKKMIRIFLIIFFAVLSALLLTAGVSRGANRSKHAIRSAGGTDKGMYVTLGGMEQYIRIRSENTSNPVIIYLHGGPGSPDGFVTYLFADKLDDKYTFVCWDQRGAGRTYEHNIKTDADNSTVSFERALSDLDELTDYIRTEYGQEKVIIMGHSYGTILGLQYTYLHPEKVSHYIGIGQDTEMTNGERTAYTATLSEARRKGDDTSKMEAAWAEYEKDMTDIMKMQDVRKYTAKYNHPTKTSNDIWNGISSPYMSISDMIYFMRQTDMKWMIHSQRSLCDTMMHTDMYDYTDFEVPVDFIMGEYDITCPTECAQTYYEQINAPSKGFHIIPGCGHCPQYADADTFAQTVLEILG